MEIKSLINPLLRWWWLIVASTIVAMISSFFATLRQPPVYQSQTTLIIGRAIVDPNPTTGEFYLAEQLAATYADIANREPVRNATMQALGLNALPDYVAQALTGSQIIQIQVTDVNPVRAQAVANELARQLILQSPTASTPEDEERRRFINDQLNRLQVQINDTQTEVERLQEELSTLTSARQISDTQSQITSLQTALTTLQSNYNGLLANTQQGAINSLTVIEQANLPRRPIGPNKPLTILTAGAIGFILAAAAAYLIEFLDDTIKTTEEVVEILGVPVIGHIGEFPEGQENWKFVSDQPRSPISDAYRTLRTNLDFANATRQRKVLLISSADVGAGKSTVASNLAAILAQAERKVILIDADLRRPTLHTWSEDENALGLSDVFRERIPIQKVMVKTFDSKISIIPSGTLPPNPTELLASERMDLILSDLRDEADTIIVDGPPFIVPDAAVLGAKCDGIILVVRPRVSRRGALKAVKEQIHRARLDVIGVVFNGIQSGLGEYQSYYLAYAREQEYSETATPNGAGKKLSGKILGYFANRRKPASDD